MPPRRSRAQSHILAVEDEPIARRELGEMLRAKYCKVSLATSGKHAVTKVSKASSDFDVILMDIMMSGLLDGIDAAFRIQQTHRDIPIIFVTAYGDNPVYHQRAEQMGLNNVIGWISKPILGENKKKLEKMLDKEVKKKEVRPEIEKALRENASPGDLQTLLKELVSLHGTDLIAEIILGIIEWLHPSNDLNTDDLFPYLNFVVYENQKAELEKDYPGQYVAFLDGDLVGNHEDQSELIKTVYQEHKRTDIFVTQIEVPTVVKLRRPRRVIH